MSDLVHSSLQHQTWMRRKWAILALLFVALLIIWQEPFHIYAWSCQNTVDVRGTSEMALHFGSWPWAGQCMQRCQGETSWCNWPVQWSVGYRRSFWVFSTLEYELPCPYWHGFLPCRLCARGSLLGLHIGRIWPTWGRVDIPSTVQTWDASALRVPQCYLST